MVLAFVVLGEVFLPSRFIERSLEGDYVPCEHIAIGVEEGRRTFQWATLNPLDFPKSLL